MEKFVIQGGTPLSGEIVPAGNKNALKLGLYTREALAERRAISRLIRESEALLKEITE